MAHKSFRFCYTFRTTMKRIDNRWIALGLLWVAYFLLQGTRQIYGATLPQIRADFGVDDLRMGAVASVFFFAYAAVGNSCTRSTARATSCDRYSALTGDDQSA